MPEDITLRWYKRIEELEKEVTRLRKILDERGIVYE